MNCLSILLILTVKIMDVSMHEIHAKKKDAVNIVIIMVAHIAFQMCCFLVVRGYCVQL